MSPSDAPESDDPNCATDQDVAQRCTRIRRSELRHGFLLFGDLTRLYREVGLLRSVETGHEGVDLLAHLDSVGSLLVKVTAKVGALTDAGGTIVKIGRASGRERVGRYVLIGGVWVS